MVVVKYTSLNNRLHSDNHKRHGFCYSQKAMPLMAAGEAGVRIFVTLNLD